MLPSDRNVTGVGHFCMLEAPGAVNDAIEWFSATLPRSSLPERPSSMRITYLL
jgi:hypothetical protein